MLGLLGDIQVTSLGRHVPAGKLAEEAFKSVECIKTRNVLMKFYQNTSEGFHWQ